MTLTTSWPYHSFSCYLPYSRQPFSCFKDVCVCTNHIYVALTIHIPFSQSPTSQNIILNWHCLTLLREPLTKLMPFNSSSFFIIFPLLVYVIRGTRIIKDNKQPFRQILPNCFWSFFLKKSPWQNSCQFVMGMNWAKKCCWCFFWLLRNVFCDPSPHHIINVSSSCIAHIMYPTKATRTRQTATSGLLYQCISCLVNPWSCCKLTSW